MLDSAIKPGKVIGLEGKLVSWGNLLWKSPIPVRHKLWCRVSSSPESSCFCACLSSACFLTFVWQFCQSHSDLCPGVAPPSVPRKYTRTSGDTGTWLDLTNQRNMLEQMLGLQIFIMEVVWSWKILWLLLNSVVKMTHRQFYNINTFSPFKAPPTLDWIIKDSSCCDKGDNNNY